MSGKRVKKQAWPVPNRGKFDIQFAGRFAIICFRPIRTRAPWHCNSDRTANIATAICPRMQRMHGSAPMNARSARIASRTDWKMSARIAAAASRLGRSGRRRHGVPASAPKRSRRRRNACISNTALRMSPRIASESRISGRNSAEGSASSLRATGSRERAPDDRLREAIQGRKRELDCFVARAPRNDGATIPPAGSSLRPRQSRRGSRRPGTSRASQASRRLPGRSA